MSVDLEKLAKQVDEALAKETPESLNKWLNERRQNAETGESNCTIESDMNAKEFREGNDYSYNHFTRLTPTGISPNYDNIEAFAEAYHKHKLANGDKQPADSCHIGSVSGCFSFEQLQENTAKNVYEYIINEHNVELPYKDWIKLKSTKMYDFGKFLNNR